MPIVKNKRKQTFKRLIRILEEDAYVHFASLRQPLFLIQFVFMIGTLGYYYIDDFTIINAIYQTGITFTTVGFGEMQPISDIGKLFTLTLIFLGFACFSFFIAVLVETTNNKALFKLLREIKMLYKIQRLTNHYVVYYYNEYTENLLDYLKKKQIPFVVVDPDPNFAAIAEEKKYPYYVIAQPHTEDTHLKTYLASAKGIITLSKEMANNIAQITSVRLYEKDIARNKYFIMSYTSDSSEVDKLRKLGADHVFSPAKLLAEKISSVLMNPTETLAHSFLDDLFFDSKNAMKVKEYKVQKENWVRLKKIKDVKIRAITNVSVIGIQYENGRIIHMPKGKYLLEGDSILLLLGTENNINKAIDILSADKMPDLKAYDV
jgi:voltage-gated potassium channel